MQSSPDITSKSHPVQTHHNKRHLLFTPNVISYSHQTSSPVHTERHLLFTANVISCSHQT
ncbi:hypothetical protein KP79_PYT15066 [Mizuhopecten yessoensis]|uniref:Uncharacterized protein n=1 Tax=Mizuhopecten yessoensis TaxID=6573 RepID=A0A210QVN2_MIZYE|nr:hypothetical protein KP79_PYT15066 [Mizuhopecten yessoensis]